MMGVLVFALLFTNMVWWLMLKKTGFGKAWGHCSVALAIGKIEYLYDCDLIYRTMERAGIRQVKKARQRSWLLSGASIKLTFITANGYITQKIRFC